MIERPSFNRPKIGRKGYRADEVDSFVELIFARLEGRPEGAAVTAVDLGIMVFHEDRGAEAYSQDEVDEWLQVVRPSVKAAETVEREVAPSPDRPGSAKDIAAPPHFADRFPRVSRAVLGYAVDEVDSVLETLRAQLTGSRPPTAEDIRWIKFSERQGGYRQPAVDQALELIALAREVP